MTSDTNDNGFKRKIEILSLAIAIISLISSIYFGYKTLELEKIVNTPYSELVKLGDSYFDEEEYEKAIKWYDRSLEIYRSPHVLKKKGFAHFNLGIDNGTGINRHIAYINAKELIDYSFNHTLTEVGEDHFEEAVECFEEASQLNPKDFEALLYKGIVIINLNSSIYDPIIEFKKIMTNIGDISDRGQGSPIVKIKDSAWYGECVSYRKIGSKEKAKECFRNLFREPEIKIISPKKGDKVAFSITVSGIFSGKLPEGRYMWLFINSEETLNRWWPQGVRIYPQKGQWDMQAWIGNTTSDIHIAVVLLDEKDDQYLWDYGRTGDKKGYYPAIPLPASATIMDEIAVMRI